MSATYTEKQIADLHSLANLEGLQTEYNSAFGTVVASQPEGLVYMLNALGVVVKDDLSDVAEVLQVRTREHWNKVVDPVVVFWEKKEPKIALRLSSDLKKKKASLEFKLENGEKFKQPVNLGRLPAKKRIKVDGKEFYQSFISVRKKFPLGYHKAKLAIGGKSYEILVISAPSKAYKPATTEAPNRSVGIFSPLYALHSNRSWGIGDFSDLGRLVEWGYSLGCDFVGTLPMLTVFSDKPIVEPSPYSPVSRIFWNELYVDPRDTAEWSECEAARAIADSQEFEDGVRYQQELREVDYLGVARLKRSVMHELAECFFQKGRDSSKEFKAFLKVQPLASDYAAFRATCDKLGSMWQEWPERMRGGELQKGDYDERDWRFYIYAQFQSHRQLSALSKKYTGNKKRGIYIDFPLSVLAGSYDVWRERDSFMEQATAGCPPDPAHVHGQNWGILPLNPAAIRKNGYRYFRACLENHMRYTGLLRLDHVMCFYRLFWVPKNKTAKEGVYVYYNMEEFFALLLLESVRNRCTLIGEDLGTVPPQIREAMTRHAILRMYCQQRRLSPNPKEPLAPVPPNCICSLNTHDMPPFAAYWQAYDVEDKMKLGYFGPDQLEAKRTDRFKATATLVKHLQSKKLLKKTPGEPEIKDVFKAMLFLTASGPAKVMQVNIEDLWQEVLAQNVPGTWKERPNWKRKLKYGLDEFASLSDVPAIFAEILKRRKGPRK